jgi:hypothetical protein
LTGTVWELELEEEEEEALLQPVLLLAGTEA